MERQLGRVRAPQRRRREGSRDRSVGGQRGAFTPAEPQGAGLVRHQQTAAGGGGLAAPALLAGVGAGCA